MSKPKPLKIMVCGGGTGGHVFPAIAIANAVKKMNKKSKILFVGAHDRMEMEKVPRAGYPIKGLWISGWQRGQVFKNILFPLKLIVSFMQAAWHIITFKPQIVIGVGGYSSGPVLGLAAFMRIPTLIQEQNSYAGVTNRLLSRVVDKICVAYEAVKKHFPSHKTVLTGNPVREEIISSSVTKEVACKHFNLTPNSPTVLIVGGSLGARSINEAIKHQLSNLKEQELQVLWQTGKRYYEEMNQAVKHEALENIHPVKFIKKMEYAYRAADVVVSRAGAITVSELCAIQKPIVLVPSPNVAEDHQTKNAMALVEKGAAKIVRDQEAKENLWKTVVALVKSEKEQKKLIKNIKQFAIKDADKRIAKEALKLTKG